MNLISYRIDPPKKNFFKCFQVKTDICFPLNITFITTWQIKIKLSPPKYIAYFCRLSKTKPRIHTWSKSATGAVVLVTDDGGERLVLKEFFKHCLPFGLLVISAAPLAGIIMWIMVTLTDDIPTQLYIHCSLACLYAIPWRISYLLLTFLILSYSFLYCCLGNKHAFPILI